jgi:hypothetical protein
MAWWRPEEEASPQSRIGARTRPVEPGAEGQPAVEHQPVDMLAPAHPPLPRRRLPISLPVALLALGFVAIMVIPFVGVFGVLSDDGGGIRAPGSADSHDGPSLIQRERFGRALTKIKELSGSEASLVGMRVAPDRIDALVRRSSGERTGIQVLADLDARMYGAAGTGPRGLSLNRIDPAVPDRVVRAGAERVGARRSDVSYLALAPVPSLGGGGIWSVFFSGGTGNRYAIADLDGGNVRVPGQ